MDRGGAGQQQPTAHQLPSTGKIPKFTSTCTAVLQSTRMVQKSGTKFITPVAGTGYTRTSTGREVKVSEVLFLS